MSRPTGPRLGAAVVAGVAFAVGLGGDLAVRAVTTGADAAPVRLGLTVLDQELVYPGGAAFTVSPDSTGGTGAVLRPPLKVTMRVRVDNRGTGPITLVGVQLSDTDLRAEPGAVLAAGDELPVELSTPLSCSDDGAGLTVPGALELGVTVQDGEGTQTQVVEADRVRGALDLTRSTLDPACGVLPGGSELFVNSVFNSNPQPGEAASTFQLVNRSRFPQRVTGVVPGAPSAELLQAGRPVAFPLELAPFEQLEGFSSSCGQELVVAYDAGPGTAGYRVKYYGGPCAS